MLHLLIRTIFATLLSQVYEALLPLAEGQSESFEPLMGIVLDDIQHSFEIAALDAYNSLAEEKPDLVDRTTAYMHHGHVYDFLRHLLSLSQKFSVQGKPGADVDALRAAVAEYRGSDITTKSIQTVLGSDETTGPRNIRLALDLISVITGDRVKWRGTAEDGPTKYFLLDAPVVGSSDLLLEEFHQ